MDKKVLVAYATKRGGTAEIAERIGEVLRDRGLATDVAEVRNVRDLAPYTAVVLGSAVYIGQWRKEAGAFLRENQEILGKKAVWLFSSGPTGEGDPVDLAQGWRFPSGLQEVADQLDPRDIAIFHGVLRAKDLNIIEKWMLKNVGAPLGDFRDWDAITEWAASIAEAVGKEE